MRGYRRNHNSSHNHNININNHIIFHNDNGKQRIQQQQQ